jgi:hypothetical protein
MNKRFVRSSGHIKWKMRKGALVKQKRVKAKRSDRLKRISAMKCQIDARYYVVDANKWQPDDYGQTGRKTLAGSSPEQQRSADTRRALEQLREERILKAAVEDDIYQPG